MNEELIENGLRMIQDKLHLLDVLYFEKKFREAGSLLVEINDLIAYLKSLVRSGDE